MWSEVKLDSLFRIGSSKRVLKSQWQTEGVPFYRGREVTRLSKYGYVDNELFVSEELYEEFSEKYGVPKAGDIVITAIGTIGNSYIVKNEDRFYFKDASVLWLNKTSDVDSVFINYWLKSPLMKDQLDEGNGATVDTLTIRKLQSLNVNLPPLAEQKRIVAILDEALAGIDTAIANTEKNLANARELFESYLNSVFTKRGDGWEEKKLGDPDLMQIVDGDRGKNYPKKSDFLDSGYCLFLNTKNVRPDGFNFDTLMFVTEEKDKALRKGKLQRRDVLITTRGTIGNIAIYDDSVKFENIRINSGMLIFRPNESVVLSEYLFEMLRSSIIKSQIARFVSGAAQPQLPIKTLVNFTIPVPTDLNQQKKIINDLHELYSTTQQLESIYQKKLNSLNELKQSLLQKAFSGELTTEPDKLMDQAVA